MLIAFFSLPPAGDDALLAAWDAAPPDRAVLHRALRDEGVGFRFVALGGAPAAPEPDHAAAYDVVAEHGTPDIAGGALLIEVWDAEPAWAARAAALEDRQGHIGGRLLHAADAAFPYVSLTRWSSPLMWFRASNDPALTRARHAAQPDHAALYQPVRGEDPLSA